MQPHDSIQILTFCLEEKTFGLNIRQVREVLEFNQITKIPKTPDFMSGVVNLRGSIIPIVDMRQKFDMGKIEYSASSRIIISELTVNQKLTVLGMCVDSVKEVLELSQDQIDPSPDIGTRLKTDFIEGLAKSGEQLLIILNLENVFSNDEVATIQDNSEILEEDS